MQRTLLQEYDALLPVFQALDAELKTRFARLLAEFSHHGAPNALGSIHTVAHRLKTRDSLAGKLARPDRTYQRLSDITDIVGVRVVTYFEDGIREVAQRVEQMFAVDLERSVDKRRQAELDRFGYRSLHYICAPSPEFLTQHNLEEGINIHFEVQLRTILQHAWAEMEHDLGYKATQAIPARIRRRFSRLAGLLELADDEFMSIKRDLHQYERDVAKHIEQEPSELELNLVSLTAFINDPSVQDADAAVATLLQQPHTEDAFYPDYLVDMLALVGLRRISELEQALSWARPRLHNFVPRYFEFSKRAWGFSSDTIGPIKRGYSLLFVAHMRLLNSARLDVELVEEVARFFFALDHPDRDTARSLAALLVEIARVDPSSL